MRIKLDSCVITGVTNFFRKKWFDIFQISVNVEALDEQLRSNNCILIQPYVGIGSRELKNVLAIYWLVEEGLIIKIDLESKSAVTFFSKQEVFRKRGEN